MFVLSISQLGKVVSKVLQYPLFLVSYVFINKMEEYTDQSHTM